MIILKLHKKLMVIILLSLTAVSLAACSNIDDWSLSLYDANGQKIDQIKAKSVYIHTDREMSKTDSNGNEKSSVIDVDYGKNRMTHVGSTLIAYEGLTNYEELNSMYQDFKNDWLGDSKVVMIRSQLGLPLAVFTGKHVSIHQSDMKNVTKFVIDGHRLLVYRADYTIYPISSLK